MTFIFASVVRRSAWIARKTFRRPAPDARENVWQLRHLDRRAAQTPGMARWGRGLPLHEEAVIAHLDNSGALQRVRRLVCEWHQWTPAAPTVHHALARLISNGFVYRIPEAGCLGDQLCPAFSNLAWPRNNLIVNAWKASLERIKASV